MPSEARLVTVVLGTPAVIGLAVPQQRGEIGRVPDRAAHQVPAQPVDEHHDVPLRVGQPQHVLAAAGDAEVRAQTGQQVGDVADP